MEQHKVLFASSEVVPFVKTGGLADVSGSLPHVLAEAGLSVTVVMPKYGGIPQGLLDGATTAAAWNMEWSGRRDPVQLIQMKDPTAPVTYLFVDQPAYFDRPELYRDVKTGRDYLDNDERFIFFCRAVLEGLKQLGWAPDVIHANDWQTALLPTFLATHYKTDPFFDGIRSVFTIHNMAFQGIFPAETFPKLGLPLELFYATGPFEFWGKVNFMKSAIWYADAITTVSERYAMEIQSSPELGCGLEGVLRSRNADIHGILNGVDYAVWSPSHDQRLPYRYSPVNLSGKKKNKVELLNRLGLPIRDDVPLVGMITRLTEQKGFDLLAAAADDLFALNLQMVILGTGDAAYHKLLLEWEKKYPDKLRVLLAFDDTLAHWIEAGADVFLMPSRYEPGGLNQMFSLKYGTVPVVRGTGGLADTVIDVDADSQGGTGFVFEEYDPEQLVDALHRMLTQFPRKRVWRKIMKTGMRQDYSWDRSAGKYARLYADLMAK